MTKEQIEVVTAKTDDFVDWRWFGSLDCNQDLFEKLRSCCAEHYLEVKLGTDGVDIWCNGEFTNTSIAYGMFCMLQHG